MPPSPTYRNRLLASLAEADLALLHPYLEPLSLPLGTVLIAQNQPITHAYFPEVGLCSVVAGTPDTARIEIGLLGRDGLAGTALVLGSDRIPHQIFIQVRGHGHRISAEALQQTLDASTTLRNLMLRYVHTFQVQTAQTALANAGAPAEERLARWLVMYHDRQDSDELSITHEFLSLMLGVRRPLSTPIEV